MHAGPRQPRDDDLDPLGMDEGGDLARWLGSFVPQEVARRGLGVRVSTDRPSFAPGETVEVTVEIRNRLPLPVSLAIEGKRLWGWSVGGRLDASEEALHASEAQRRLDLRGFETRRLEVEWNGRFKRPGSPTRWVPADPGEYEIRAFVPTVGGRVEAATTVILEP